MLWIIKIINKAMRHIYMPGNGLTSVIHCQEREKSNVYTRYVWIITKHNQTSEPRLNKNANLIYESNTKIWHENKNQKTITIFSHSLHTCFHLSSYSPISRNDFTSARSLTSPWTPSLTVSRGRIGSLKVGGACHFWQAWDRSGLVACGSTSQDNPRLKRTPAETTIPGARPYWTWCPAESLFLIYCGTATKSPSLVVDLDSGVSVGVVSELPTNKNTIRSPSLRAMLVLLCFITAMIVSL
jgi:hypothetical protein